MSILILTFCLLREILSNNENSDCCYLPCKQAFCRHFLLKTLFNRGTMGRELELEPSKRRREVVIDKFWSEGTLLWSQVLELQVPQLKGGKVEESWLQSCWRDGAGVP